MRRWFTRLFEPEIEIFRVSRHSLVDDVIGFLLKKEEQNGSNKRSAIGRARI